MSKRVTNAAIKKVCDEQYMRCKQQGINFNDCLFSFDDYAPTKGMSDKQWVFGVEYWHSLISEPVPSWIYEPLEWPVIGFGG